MLARHAALGLALAVAGLVVGSATVLAGDGDDRQELHAERHVRHVRSDDVVIDRSRALLRLDRLLEGIDDIAEATRTPWRRGFGPLRLERGAQPTRVDDDARGTVRERGGERPLADTELSHRSRGPAAVEEGLYELRKEVLRLRRAVERAPELQRAPVIVEMPDRDFHGFLRAVRRAPFADDKVAVVIDVAHRAHFTSEQAVDVLRVIPSWGQVDAAFALHDRLVDPEGIYRLYAAVTFASDRDRLRRRVAGVPERGHRGQGYRGVGRIAGHR